MAELSRSGGTNGLSQCQIQLAAVTANCSSQ
jgi:hypothetical protein